MRRHVPPKVSDTTYLVVSYVPLLRGVPGMMLELEQANDALDAALQTEAGRVEAVVWALDESGSPWPVLVLERAAEVYEHLVEWSEGNPAAWFTLAWTAAGGSYALALVPRYDRSIERYRAARILFAGEAVPADAQFKIVFVPVTFSGPESSIAREMLPRLPSRVRVGFLARAELTADLSDIDAEAVRTCGPVEVERDRTGYLERLL